MVPGFQRSPDLGGQLTSGEHMTREAEVVALRKAFSLPPVPTAMDAMSFPPSLCCGVEQSRAFSWSRRLSSSPSPLLFSPHGTSNVTRSPLSSFRERTE